MRLHWATEKMIWAIPSKMICKILFNYYKILKSMLTFDAHTDENLSNLSAFNV
jgi:hypothetical protein